MRLFVAVVPPPRVIQDLDAAVRPLRAEQPALTWTTTEAWHLTLAFFGEVADEALPELRKRLNRAAGRHERMDLAFEGAGRFDGRVFWAGVSGDRTKLRRLADSAGAAGRRSGIPVEERTYRPHLTLARARNPIDLRPLVEGLTGYRGPRWTADRVALIRSQLGAGPGRRAKYTEVASWSLQPSRRVPTPQDVRPSDQRADDHGEDE